jgi:hypothetical protein
MTRDDAVKELKGFRYAANAPDSDTIEALGIAIASLEREMVGVEEIEKVLEKELWMSGEYENDKIEGIKESAQAIHELITKGE